jgi:hypothetical protein
VSLELVAAPGATADQLYVWLPDKRVVFSGDNFYRSWPNLYAIRGTPYRDIRAWAEADDMMLAEDAEFLVPGHTRPVIGRAAVAQALTDYRDAIGFIFEKTIRGVFQRRTPAPRRCPAGQSTTDAGRGGPRVDAPVFVSRRRVPGFRGAGCVSGSRLRPRSRSDRGARMTASPGLDGSRFKGDIRVANRADDMPIRRPVASSHRS